MITKSPPSTCGVKVALCLPRRRFAVCTARRPRTSSVASMTCHSRWMSAGFGLYVRTVIAFCRNGDVTGGSPEGGPGAGHADGHVGACGSRDPQDYREPHGPVKTAPVRARFPLSRPGE